MLIEDYTVLYLHLTLYPQLDICRGNTLGSITSCFSFRLASTELPHESLWMLIGLSPCLLAG